MNDPANKGLHIRKRMARYRDKNPDEAKKLIQETARINP
jgi:hypothetical protein